MLFSRIQSLLSSLKTSIWVLSGMTVLYVLGTIFPQGAELQEYAEAGGRYLFLVRALGLLDLFTSPLFLALSGLLCLNLLVCILERFRRMRKRRELISREAFFRSPNLLEIGGKEVFPAVEERLTRWGFKLIDAGQGQYLFGKGLPYWWLSWTYHLGMIAAIGGFLITAFAAHEDTVSLWPGKTEKISLYSSGTRLNRHLRRLGLDVPERRPEREFTITLDGFSTEYYQSLSFDYPEDALSRLAIGLGWRRIEPAHESGLSPKMWKTTFTLGTPEGEQIRGEARVNHPFRYRGLTLYQMGYEQRMTLAVDGEDMEVTVYRPFRVTGVEGRFLAKTVKLGRMIRKDGTIVEIEPRFELFYLAPDGRGEERIGTVHLDRPIRAKGKELLFKGPVVEASVLSYRVDPGVPLIGLSTLLVFLGLLLRSYGYWYRVRIAEREGRLYMTVSTRGLLARREKVTRRLSA